jgi:GWxTD domain-containing protein
MPSRLSWLIFCAASIHAAQPGWLDLVAPLLTSDQKKLYLSLPPETQVGFEQHFWEGKGIGAEEYFQRVQYIDANFGSGRAGSGANTDQGRVYLSLGPPNRVSRIHSSRIFVPLEIWYYDTVPAIHLTTELRLIFYQPQSIGFLKLYSPTLDTIRALFLPQASTNGMFGPNDEITEAALRTNLNVSTAEDEIITASVSVASGVKYSGNDQVLGQITSPMFILGKPLRPDVESRLIVARPNLEIVAGVSPYGGSQVDLEAPVQLQHELSLEVFDGPVPVYRNRLHLKFARKETVRYRHRFDLLPGQYRLLLTVDGTAYPYMIDIPEHLAMSTVFRADECEPGPERQTPFEFDGRHFERNPAGRMAVVLLPQPGKVTWILRQGAQAVWKAVSEARQAAIIELPTSGVAPGNYRLEASSDTDWKHIDVVIGRGPAVALTGTTLSFNANLAPASRLASVGHQWLLRGEMGEARRSIQASLGYGTTPEAQIEQARLDALEGKLDIARDKVRAVLSRDPNNFEALTVFAYIETRFQDYPVAADLYRHALSVEDSPALRLALMKLPQ